MLGVPLGPAACENETVHRFAVLVPRKAWHGPGYPASILRTDRDEARGDPVRACLLQLLDGAGDLLAGTGLPPKARLLERVTHGAVGPDRVARLGAPGDERFHLGAELRG
jgi:hypothetical protein